MFIGFDWPATFLVNTKLEDESINCEIIILYNKFYVSVYLTLTYVNISAERQALVVEDGLQIW